MRKRGNSRTCSKILGRTRAVNFDRKFIVAELPAYAAKVGNIIGFASFTEADEVVIVVALGILPQYQSSGVGRSLIEKVEVESKRLLVSTSNDDLPALAFYQSLGFQIYEVKPNVIAEKHCKILQAIRGLPVRDESRLREILH